MKIFLTLFFSLFIFHSSSNAEDISEFEIEGMSVGNKLSDYISKNKIESSFNNATYYKNKKFLVIFINTNSTIYNRLQATLKSNDNNYIIYSLEGIIDFDKNIEGCVSKKKEIFNDLKSFFKDSEIIHNDSVYSGDESGKSFTYGTWFYLKNGGYASITCTEMGEKVREERGWTDELSIAISNQEFLDFLQNEAYN